MFLKEPPRHSVGLLGAKFSLICTTESPKVQVSWSKMPGGTPFHSGPSLTFEMLYLANISSYYCKAENETCSQSKSQELLVEYKWGIPE